MVAMIAFAGSPMKVTSGSVKGLNAAGTTFFVQFDYSADKVFDEDTEKTMSEHEFCVMKGADWVSTEGQDHAEAEKSFGETFNAKSKGIEVVADKAAAAYTIVWHIDLFCYGNPVAGMIVGGFAGKNVAGFADGHFDIVENATGNVVATVKHERIYGSNFAASWAIKREYVYDNVAEELAKLIKKGK